MLTPFTYECQSWSVLTNYFHAIDKILEMISRKLFSCSLIIWRQGRVNGSKIQIHISGTYLLEYQANVSAVNNDGELAIDISESDEMEELLQKEIDKQGINCDESRNTEERLMLEDARSWLNAKVSFSLQLLF